MFCRHTASAPITSGTRCECRWPRADAAVHQHSRACTAVIHLHLPRVSQLLLPSCSFSDLHPATKLFSWYKNSNSDGFPGITDENHQNCCEKVEIPAIRFVPGKDEEEKRGINLWTRHIWVFDCLRGQDVVGSLKKVAGKNPGSKPPKSFWLKEPLIKLQKSLFFL